MFEINFASAVEVAAAWSNLVEPGDSAAGILIAEMGAAPALQWLLNSGKPADLPAAIKTTESGKPLPWKQAVARWLPRINEVNVKQQLENLERMGGELWYPQHPRWPEQLNDLGEVAPVALWVRGNLAASAPRAQIALVGARAATSSGEQIATEFAYELTQAGFSIVSGGAFGIDAAAHRGAIRGVQQLPLSTISPKISTVAFMAGGISQLYPASQIELFNQIEDAGLIMSEVPPTWRPAKWRFLARNRLIAAFSQAVVVVEAGIRSGALATAHRGLELGRPVGAIPGSIYSQMSFGCHQLIREADATLISSVKDVKELVSAVGEYLEYSVLEPKQSQTEFSSVYAQRVWQALPKRQRTTVCAVAAVSGLSMPEVNAALAELVVAGQAEVFADQCWRK